MIGLLIFHGIKGRKLELVYLPLIERVIDLNNLIVLYIFVLKIEHLEHIFFELIKAVYSRKTK
jgi:hypothetical protein